MRHIGAEALVAALPYPALIDALRAAFAAGAEVPLRSHHEVPGGGAPGTLLLMPAWTKDGSAIGIKTVTVFPANGARGLPAVQACYLLLDGSTGQPQALLDGPTLTARRTAAASALAADWLARPDARRLAMVGTGVLARQLPLAHSAVRPIDEVTVWGRDPAKAEAAAAFLRKAGLTARPSDDLEAAVRGADIVSCATMASEPLVRGAWLAPGTHLDLVGGYTPTMREADDDAVTRSRIFVDTRDGALKEAGDVVDPIRRGVLPPERVEADLYELARGWHTGRVKPDEITFFKSVGSAIEDLAAARLAVSRLGA